MRYNTHIRKPLLLFVVLMNSTMLFSQRIASKVDYIINKRMLSVEDGLPSRLVFEAVQDRDGFMWFATANGLCRYDGYSFKIYNKQNSGLPSNTITGLALGDKNQLFIQATLNYGTSDAINIYQVLDLNTYQFKQMDQVLSNMPFKAEQIDRMIHDASGNIYFFTDQRSKIWQLSRNSTFKLRKDFKNAAKSSLPQIYPSSNLFAANDCILIHNYNLNQDYCVYPDTTISVDNATIKLVSITEKKEFLIFDEILKTFFLMNASGRKEKAANTAFISQSEKSGINFIKFEDHSLLYKSDLNNYYLRTADEWIEIYNAGDRSNIIDFGVNTYFKDRGGNYWFCTEKGIYQVNIRKNQFGHIFSNQRDNLFVNNAVRAIYVDRNKTNEKRVYAMVNYGLMIKEKSEKKIQNIVATNLLRKNNWLYVAGNPLYMYNPANGQIKKSTNFIDIGEIWSLADFSDSILLIGVSSGILSYNIYSSVSRLIPNAQKNIPTPSNVYRMLHSKAKGWIAVAENGIYFINDQCVIYDFYGQKQSQKEKRLPFTGIYDFYEDKKGIGWLAMNGEGLIRWNWNTHYPMDPDNFKRFTVENGLPDNILCRIEEDNSNNLWISSYSGLVRFNKNNFSTSIYRTKDGLVNTEFNRISSFKDSEGWMYFGGQNGIDFVDPVKMNRDADEKMIAFQLVGLTKYSAAKDTIVSISDELFANKNIVLHVGDKFLSVSFSLLDYQNRPHRYAYRIEGLDKEWNYVNENVIRISGLPYGEFKLKIKAQLESGNWSAQEIVIPISVLKPFYLKTWFFVLSSALLILFFLMIYLYRVNKLKRDKFRLESLVQKRTNSLSEALEDREMLLKEIHHRVKNNLQVITGLLQLQKEELKDQKVVDAFNEGQSRVSSIALIHQNLYQNKDLGNIEFKSFLQDLYNQVAELYENENRKITLTLHLDETYIDIDTAVPLGLIVNEMLTNSYKYAFVHQTKAKVDIGLIQYEKGKYKLTYHDNGPGVKDVPDFNDATTLGMNLIGGLAKQLSGKAEYVFEQGSKFVIYFKDSELRKSEK